MFKKITLKNGLRIISAFQKNTQSVTILVLVKTGSKYETKEINGISHFLEHMFFKGTKKRPNTTIIAETLDRVGGIYNAFTGEDYTGYFAKVSSKHFDLALDWVSDIFLNSKLEKCEIEKEKGVIVEEINMIFDNPMSYIQLLWKELLYKDQPAGWNIAGTKETVRAITQEKLFDYLKSQYVSQNTVVSIAGNFKDFNTIVKKVEKSFSKIKNKNPKNKEKVVENQKSPGLILKEKKTDQTNICLGVRGYNLFCSQRYAQEILGVILGGMMSSRLFIKVRERLGLAYYISTEVSSDPDTGFLVTQAGVDNKNVLKAITTILKEYKEISQKKVPEQELKKAKEYIEGKMALSFETSDNLSSFYGFQEILEEKIFTPEEIYYKIDSVKAEDILKVAKEIFQPQRLNLAVLGPFKDKKDFEKILKL